VNVVIDLDPGLILRDDWFVELVCKSSTPERFPVSVQCIVGGLADKSERCDIVVTADVLGDLLVDLRGVISLRVQVKYQSAIKPR